MALEDEESLTECEDHMEESDNNVEMTDTELRGSILSKLHQFKAVLYHACRAESCTSVTVAQ